MRWLEKIRRIFASDKTYSKRDRAGLARNSIWVACTIAQKPRKMDGAASQKITMKRIIRNVVDCEGVFAKYGIYLHRRE